WIIRDKLVADGRYYIVQTILHGEHYLRVSLMNPLSTHQELRGLLGTIRDLALKVAPGQLT
ncbi:MAG TPA: hypothetical protein VGE15_08355, partial [Sphingobacteriaceae bacterium]